MNRLYRSALLPLVLFGIAFFAFRGTLHNEFVWDDRYLIEENPYIQSLDNLPDLFTKNYFKISGIELTYRPICTLTYFLDYAIWNGSPWGFHLTNILLHGVNAVLLYLLLSRLFEKTSTSMFAAAAFAVHPALSEAVAGATFREDLLYMLFMLFSMIAWLAMRRARSKGEEWTFALVSIVNFGVALLSKETALMMPALILAYEHFCEGGARAAYRKRPFYYFGIGLAAAAYLYLRLWAFANAAETPVWHGGGPVQTAATMFFCFMKYIGLAIAPVKLCVDYTMRISSGLFEPRALLSLAGLVLFFAVMFRLKKSAPGASLGLAWFFLLLLPAANIFPIAVLMNERYLYGPLAGFCLFTSVLLFEANFLDGRVSQAARKTIGILIVGIFAALAINRIPDWNNPAKLWKEAAVCSPNSPQARVNLGRALIEQNKEYDGAIFQLTKAIELAEAAGKADRYGSLYKAYGNRAIAYAQVGLIENSLTDIQAALHINPLYEFALKNDQIIYLNYRNQKEYLRVKAFFEELAKLDPSNVSVLSILGRHKFYDNDLKASRRYFERVAQLEPDNIIARSYLNMLDQRESRQ